VREEAEVKLGGFFGVVIEPEEWRNFVHGWHSTSREVSSDKKGFVARRKARRSFREPKLPPSFGFCDVQV
jgi:hypothetical protein